MNRTLLIILAILLLWAWRDWNRRDIEHPPGQLVPEAPRQSEVADPETFAFEGYELTQRAGLEIRARVLSTENYYLGNESDLSPIDLALGWGPMSDQAILDQIDIHQGNRWYFMRWEYPTTLPEKQIVLTSGNMHIIPAEPWVAKELKKLRRGDVVKLDGMLVDVDHASGFKWRSSLSREDSGDGSCEIFFVQSIQREPRP